MPNGGIALFVRQAVWFVVVGAAATGFNSLVYLLLRLWVFRSARDSQATRSSPQSPCDRAQRKTPVR